MKAPNVKWTPAKGEIGKSEMIEQKGFIYYFLYD